MVSSSSNVWKYCIFLLLNAENDSDSSRLVMDLPETQQQQQQTALKRPLSPKTGTIVKRARKRGPDDQTLSLGEPPNIQYIMRSLVFCSF